MWTSMILCLGLAQEPHTPPPTAPAPDAVPSESPAPSPPHPTAERIAKARQHLDAGRAVDCFRELDRALAEEPGDPAVRAFLAERRDSRGLGIELGLRPARDAADAEELFERAAGRAQELPPAARELALLSLRDWSFVELGPELVQARRDAWLIDARAARRRLAAEWLRQEYAPQRAHALLTRALLDADAGVRTAAATALRSAREPGLVLPMVEALGHDSAIVRENAASALGFMGYPEAVPALAVLLLAPPSSSGYEPPATYGFFGTQRAYVQDFDVEVATGSAIADPVINVLTEGSVVGARLLHVSPKQIRTTLRASLRRLTGTDPGTSPRAQAAWWEAHRERYEALLKPRPE